MFLLCFLRRPCPLRSGLCFSLLCKHIVNFEFVESFLCSFLGVACIYLHELLYCIICAVFFRNVCKRCVEGIKLIMNAVTSGTSQTIAASTQNAANAINAIKDGNAALIREFGTVETAITALSGKQQECCCNTLRAIDSVNYNSAVNTAAINANVTAQVQSIKDMLYAQRDQEQQARITNLELQNALAGVIRFPSQYTFNGGVFPPVVTAGA